MRICETDNIRMNNAPYIDDNNALVIFAWTSLVRVCTPDMVVLGCGRNLVGPPTDWYIFVDGGGVPVQVRWDDLDDNQRLTMRSSGVRECDIPGKYTDARYYTLEALS